MFSAWSILICFNGDFLYHRYSSRHKINPCSHCNYDRIGNRGLSWSCRASSKTLLASVNSHKTSKSLCLVPLFSFSVRLVWLIYFDYNTSVSAIFYFFSVALIIDNGRIHYLPFEKVKSGVK